MSAALFIVEFYNHYSTANAVEKYSLPEMFYIYNKG